jgi:hypothetical protein
VNGASGASNLAIPISGPKAKGTIYVSANKSLGQWNYSGSSWKSDKRINVSISSKNRRGPSRANNPRLSSAGTTIKLRYNLDCQDQ